MRKFVAPVLCAVMMVGMAAVSTGCTAKASVSAGTQPAKPPPPPPPPPPAKPAAEPAKPPARQKVTNFQMENGALKLPGPVVFETGKDVLKPESDAVLEVVVDYLEAKPEITLLRIEGHTDTDGKADANQKLSEGRSLAVARWLTGKGVDCKRLLPVGFGQTKPVADNNTPEGKAQNRRTSFVNAALRGKPIGGMPVDGGGKVAGDPCR
jgi:OOP family OmpA-OmpF porin